MAVTATTDVGGRRMAYGANWAVQIALAIILAVGAVVVGQRFNTQTDVTRTGVNTLTPRSVNLVQRLTEPITITAVYGVARVDDKQAEERKDKVKSLLSLYQRANPGQVTTTLIDPVKDPGQVLEVLKKIRELPKHNAEAEPAKKIRAGYPDLNKRLTQLATDDVRALEAIKVDDAELKQTLTTIVNNLTDVATTSADTTDEINQIEARGVAALSEAVNQIQSQFQKSKNTLFVIAEFAKRAEVKQRVKAWPELAAWIESVPSRYEKLMADMDGLLALQKDAKRGTIEQIEQQLENARNQGVILVSSAREARALPFHEVFPHSQEAAPGSDNQYEFAGEAAVSSAVLQLTQLERTAVVFVRFGGEAATKPDFNPAMMRNMSDMPHAPFQALAMSLEKANFVVDEWDLEKNKQPPKFDTEKLGESAESVKRTIYVVLPVAPEEQQQSPFQRTPPKFMSDEDKTVLFDAIDRAGMSMFMASWRPAHGGMNPIAPYPYTEYLARNWGVDVRSEYLVLAFAQMPDPKDGWTPAAIEMPTQLLSFSEHAVSKLSKFQQVAFPKVCPVLIRDTKDRPAGVEPKALISIASFDVVWAMKNVEERAQRSQKEQTGIQREPDDMMPPFPIGVAASRKDGDKPEQRMIVWGSADFASDAIAQRRVPVMIGSQLATAPLNPGNSDVFLNALYWLSNDADRISVGAKGNDLPRLSRLAGSMTTALHALLVAGMPALVILLGGAVWYMRRR